MTTTTFSGYHDRPYLTDDYDVGIGQAATGMQATQIIAKQVAKGMQAKMIVTVSSARGMQAKMFVTKSLAKGMQAAMHINDRSKVSGMQAREVVSISVPKGMQALQIVTKSLAKGMQASMHINNHTKSVGMQVLETVAKQAAKGMQASQFVTKSRVVGMQALMLDIENILTGMQVNETLKAQAAKGMQSRQEIQAMSASGMQARMVELHNIYSGMQAYMHLSGTKTIGMEAKQGKLRHAIQQYYLEYGYLEGDYMVDLMGAFLGMQVNQINKVQTNTGMQASQVVNKNVHTGMQSLMVVNTESHRGMQALMLNKFALGMQATMVIYNTTQLRIMTTFPSRGTAALLGLNWAASTTASGDFSPNNLNTDIIEQVYRSGAGSASLVTLTCDSGLSQGVPVDTIAILGHNFTKSAIVQVQGSNDPLFGSINISFTMQTELTNMYYIAPTFPNLAGQNRYWRYIIQDETNPAGYIEVGTILFGVSHIFSILESFVNPVKRGFKHFKDELKTEGFTAVMNDRALKKWLRLSFEELLFFNRNYTILEDMMTFARTSLKVLVIPTPEYPSRFAIFAKLTQLPDISHNSVGVAEEYIDLELEWDESL